MLNDALGKVRAASQSVKYPCTFIKFCEDEPAEVTKVMPDQIRRVNAAGEGNGLSQTE